MRPRTSLLDSLGTRARQSTDGGARPPLRRGYPPREAAHPAGLCSGRQATHIALGRRLHVLAPVAGAPHTLLGSQKRLTGRGAGSNFLCGVKGGRIRSTPMILFRIRDYQLLKATRTRAQTCTSKKSVLPRDARPPTVRPLRLSRTSEDPCSVQNQPGPTPPRSLPSTRRKGPSPPPALQSARARTQSQTDHTVQ